MINFAKLCANGNDFLIIKKDDESKIDKKILDRHIGIGSDDAVLFEDSSIADYKLSFAYDSKCANAIICSAKYYSYISKNTKSIIKAEIENKQIDIFCTYDKKFSATLDLGIPSLAVDSNKINEKINIIYDYNLNLSLGQFKINCATIQDTLHVIVFSFCLEDSRLKQIANEIQKNKLFNIKPFVSFVKLDNHFSLSIRTFSPNGEEIFSSGEAACCASFAGIIHFNISNELKINYKFDDCQVLYDKKSDHMTFTNSADIICTGTYISERIVDFAID